ncbi:P-loop containing nucleoside triphosphate hydrolase protein, partial [Suillus clintonianus]|uniref:P-loop containing nucleoside triphosphate hydrolase protein n=1 Tax=Suillus clintonianus TaxID=1904413 RepID=UPI001B86DD82
NVVIIGQSGAGKSSLINMLCPGAHAPVSNDTTGCTRVEKEYKCDLGQQQYCQVHDTVGLEEGRWGFLPDKPAQKKLKAYLAMMMKRTPSELDLLVYCIPGTRGLKKSHCRNFNNFKQEVGNVHVVVVVTHLDNWRGHLETWWTKNALTLEKLGIPDSTKHACVTTLPKDYLNRSQIYLYDQSCEDVKALIRNNLPRIR